MAHKTREEYKKSCKFYVLGWCCETEPFSKKVCKGECIRVNHPQAKDLWACKSPG